ncbi:MAG: Rpn family recombination-promoting nuclease/putative transposase [Clostridium sp.]|nr:Rpn family recombination-promoting nuclease/putative transposase [Clostridium sp.]
MNIFVDEKNFIMKPKNDLVFKKIFGDERNKDLLISLLNSILEEKIEDVTLENTELIPEYISSKKGILDIRATTDKGVQVDIEIQVLRISHMPERSLFYWSRMYIEQIATGDDYGKLNKTITINILDYNCIENDRYHNSFHVREDKENIKLTDVLEIHFIELKKENKENDKLAQWMEFIKADSKEVLEHMAESNPDIKRAVELLEIISQDKETRAIYLAREMALRDEISRVEEGKTEGRAEGRAEGIKESISKLLSKGKSEIEISELLDVDIKLVEEVKETMKSK